MEEILIMKRFVAALFIMALLSACSTLTSCGNGDGLPGGETPSSSRFYSKSGLFFPVHTELAYASFDSPFNAYYACTNPLCMHSSYRCPAFGPTAISHTLIVEDEERKMPLVFFFSRRDNMIYVDGEPTQNYDQNLGSTFVFDTESGEGRLIAETDYTNAANAYYYRGNIYLTADYLSSISNYRVGRLGVADGKYREVDTGTGACIIGIWNERVYYLTLRGTVYSCDAELSDIREEYVVGPESFPDVPKPMWAYVDDGMLYFSRGFRVVDEFDKINTGDKNAFLISDVYAVDLSDVDSGEKLVAEGVYKYKPHDGKLYYTVWDYEEYGTKKIDVQAESYDPLMVYEWTICSYDGGTLYVYDPQSATSDKICSDIGVSFADIYDIADGCVIFRGKQYRDVDDCLNDDMQIFLCRLDLGDGSWETVYHTNNEIGTYGK